jgi:hypothetical protein
MLPLAGFKKPADPKHHAAIVANVSGNKGEQPQVHILRSSNVAALGYVPLAGVSESASRGQPIQSKGKRR